MKGTDTRNYRDRFRSFIPNSSRLEPSNILQKNRERRWTYRLDRMSEKNISKMAGIYSMARHIYDV